MVHLIKTRWLVCISPAMLMVIYVVMYRRHTTLSSNLTPMSRRQTSGGKRQTHDSVFVDVTELLKATPDTDDILEAPPVKFLKGVKNPCFALTDKNVNVVNITISVAIDKGYHIRCLPYVYIAGFTKAASTFMFLQLSGHRLLSGGRASKGSGKRSIRTKSETGTHKEDHFWDNMFFVVNYTVDQYSSFFSSKKIVESFNRYGEVPREKGAKNDFRDLIYVDATPRTIWHGDTWDKDQINSHLKEPVALLPHKLHHLQPNAKFIVSLREPASRLVSDFQFYYRGIRAPNISEIFHSKVVDAIRWWKDCTEKMGRNSRACVYGKAPKGLPELGFEICMRNQTHIRRYHRQACQSQYGWTKNSADRLRVSMYDLFIKEWLKIFPRENFLFVKFEDYKKAPVAYLKKVVLPFLNLPPFSRKLRQKHMSHHPRITVLPKTKAILDEFYQQTKESLAKLLKDDRFLWKDI